MRILLSLAFLASAHAETPQYMGHNATNDVSGNWLESIQYGIFSLFDYIEFLIYLMMSPSFDPSRRSLRFVVLTCGDASEFLLQVGAAVISSSDQWSIQGLIISLGRTKMGYSSRTEFIPRPGTATATRRSAWLPSM